VTGIAPSQFTVKAVSCATTLRLRDDPLPSLEGYVSRELQAPVVNLDAAAPRRPSKPVYEVNCCDGGKTRSGDYQQVVQNATCMDIDAVGSRPHNCWSACLGALKSAMLVRSGYKNAAQYVSRQERSSNTLQSPSRWTMGGRARSRPIAIIIR
jgi:hypothetical protein